MARISLLSLLSGLAALWIFGVVYFFWAPPAEAPAPAASRAQHALRAWGACDTPARTFAVGGTLSLLSAASGLDRSDEFTGALELGVFAADWPALVTHMQGAAGVRDTTAPHPCAGFDLSNVFYFAPDGSDVLLKGFASEVAVYSWRSGSSASHEPADACKYVTHTCRAEILHVSTNTPITIHVIFRADGYAWLGVPSQPLAAPGIWPLSVLEPFAVAKQPLLPVAAPTRLDEFEAAWLRRALVPCNHSHATAFRAEHGIDDQTAFNDQVSVLGGK